MPPAGHAPHRAARGAHGLPVISPWLLGAFARYTRWYLRRHFYAVRISTEGWLPDNESAVPKVIYLNHPAWWDPLVCLHLARSLFAGHRGYAPIEARAIEKYPFFRRLGFFGVEADTARGAAAFLRTSHALLAEPWAMLWVTPQGRFADVRDRPARFRHGLGHLAARVGAARPGHAARVQFIPLALEYTWWHERLPEVLLRFGAPLELTTATCREHDPEGWSRALETRLETAMDALAADARARDPEKFLNLLAGRAGVGGVYDVWRRLKAALRGRRFDPRHGRL